MQTIDKFNFAGKKAFVRVDFNVPLDENFNITDDTRMRAALPTLKKILADGGSIIIGSHLGRPKGVADKFSLKHIIKHLSELLGVEVQFANDCMGEEAAVKAAALQPGEVLLLENLRFYAEEEGKPRGLAEDATDEEKAAAKKAVKESQKEFTKKLASYADCYVLALDLMKKAKEKGVNLILAVDAKIADAFSNDANTKFCAVDEIPDGWEGLDIGPKTEEIFANVIKESKTILWNGPTGVFEFDNFTHGSRAVGEAIVEATKNGAFSLVGGGDSVACVNKFGLASGVSYVSTGGGALLEAIEGKVLPGIAAIQE